MDRNGLIEASADMKNVGNGKWSANAEREIMILDRLISALSLPC
jgi:hypothetical protein